MLSVPVFMVALGLTRLLVRGLESIALASLRPLLLLQLTLLAGFLILCVAAGPSIDPSAETAIFAGMLGVSAMAVQNALVQVSLKGARRRMNHTWPAIIGFAVGCGFGAACEAAFGPWRCPWDSPCSHWRLAGDVGAEKRDEEGTWDLTISSGYWRLTRLGACVPAQRSAIWSKP
jgi:hypothetical protein